MRCTRLPTRTHTLPARRLARVSRVVAARAAPPLPPSLDATLAALAAGAHADDTIALTATLAQVEADASSAGVAKVPPESGDRDGAFDAFPLTGRTAARLSAPLPLAMLTFNTIGPPDLTVTVSPGGHPRVAAVERGPFYGRPNAYAVSTCFDLALDDGDIVPGVSRAIGTYEVGGEERMAIVFDTIRVEPLATDAASLAAWTDALSEANPSLDARTGVIEVTLPAPAPGWQDAVAVGGRWQLLRGNAGSLTLLRRRE